MHLYRSPLFFLEQNLLIWKSYPALVCFSLTTNMNIFRIYCSGSHGPVLLLLHGGGHSALSWAVFTVSIITAAESLQLLYPQKPYVSTTWIFMKSFFFISGWFLCNIWFKWSFCPSLQAVICSRINCRVVAMDLRAHGKYRGPKIAARHTDFRIKEIVILLSDFTPIAAPVLKKMRKCSCCIKVDWSFPYPPVIRRQVSPYHVIWPDTLCLFRILDRDNSEMCFSFPGLQATPKWKTLMISLRTRWPSRLLCVQLESMRITYWQTRCKQLLVLLTVSDCMLRKTDKQESKVSSLSLLFYSKGILAKWWRRSMERTHLPSWLLDIAWVGLLQFTQPQPTIYLLCLGCVSSTLLKVGAFLRRSTCHLIDFTSTVT